MAGGPLSLAGTNICATHDHHNRHMRSRGVTVNNLDTISSIGMFAELM